MEDGVVPEGLTHSIQDPDAEEDKGEESVGVVSTNDGAPTKESKNKVTCRYQRERVREKKRNRENMEGGGVQDKNNIHIVNFIHH